jgi:hypothetical protein
LEVPDFSKGKPLTVVGHDADREETAVQLPGRWKGLLTIFHPVVDRT